MPWIGSGDLGGVTSHRCLQLDITKGMLKDTKIEKNMEKIQTIRNVLKEVSNNTIKSKTQKQSN